MSEFNFTLIVHGVPALSTEIENAIFEAGCDDATLTIRGGKLYAEFSRSAESREAAIASAKQDILRVGIGTGMSES